MSFLAPLFLLGTLALALPVVFHLIRRTTRERTAFSSLMFLLPSPPRLTRRSRLEDILLLLLRCVVLCLVAVGFARPLLRHAAFPPDTSTSRRLVVLLDTSASMQRASLWADARWQAQAIVDKASPADQVALVTFDRQVSPLMSFAQWNSLPAGERAAVAGRMLAAKSPGWSATDLGLALITAAETLADNGGKTQAGPGEIVLLSDIQEGGRVQSLQGYEWPQDVQLSVVPLKAGNHSNAGLQLLADPEEAEPHTASAVRVRVSNAADSRREQFQVGWARSGGHKFIGQPSAVYVPPGQSRVALVPVLQGEPGLDRIVLEGDEDDFDNTVFVTPPETARVEVVYLGRDVENDAKQPLYFLEHAFQDTPRQTIHLLAHGPAAAVSPSEARTAALFVVTDSLSDESAAALHQEVAGGKTVLFMLKNDAAGATLARLLGVGGLEAKEAAVGNYAMLAEIDFRHGLFAPFADPRFSDFSKIHFWKYRRLDPAGIPAARVLARFDSGDPAILEAPVGQGRAIILTSGWQPADSQLALSSKFVPLLFALLEQSGGAPAMPLQYHVGDIVPLPAGEIHGASQLSIRAPDGSELKLSANQTNFTQTLTPGIYTLVSAQPPRRFAINLDPAESRTAPLPLDEFERLGVRMSHPDVPKLRQAQRKVRLQNAELENRQKLWRGFLVAAIGVLLLETWLAGWAARQRQDRKGATA